MKAMVFAAGVGSRLGSLTAACPKCLMPLGKETILSHVINRLKLAGVTEVVINLHHLAQMVIDYVTSQSFFGIKVFFSHEESLLDTGGGLKRAMNFFLNEPAFFVHNSDIYSETDLNLILSAHSSANAMSTLLLRDEFRDESSRRGLYFDDSMQLVGWTAESSHPPENSKFYAFCGIQVTTPKIFSLMPNAEVFSIIEPYMSASNQGERVLGFISSDKWIDIGTPERLKHLQERFSV